MLESGKIPKERRVKTRLLYSVQGQEICNTLSGSAALGTDFCTALGLQFYFATPCYKKETFSIAAFEQGCKFFKTPWPGRSSIWSFHLKTYVAKTKNTNN